LKKVLETIENLYNKAKNEIKKNVTKDGTLEGKISAQKLNEKQMQAHALAYFATELEACREMAAWAERCGDFEKKIASAYIGEFARTLRSGVTLSSSESVSSESLGLTSEDLSALSQGEVAAFIQENASETSYIEIATIAQEKGYGDLGLEDEMLSEIRSQFAKFVNSQVIPIAQEIHREDKLIPMNIVEQMAELGVFGLTIPEEYDGLGLSKVAMCVVTEELSRGYIGVGSLGTRSEIAAELILGGGTEEQKKRWLPALASGEVLSTAVFTEPNNGSDLAHLGTKAVRQEDGSYVISGQKTWITHAVRADLMTVLARTNPSEPGYKGLSMFLAEKTRLSGEDGEPEFVDEGLSGTEIKVLGYRGMKEYELSLDGFKVPEAALLGGEEGAGFKQLMRTFESARIQTAARGVGVAQAALEDAMLYANEREQFGGPIFQFPRVARKIGRMIVNTQAARQLTFFSARQKDSEKRCDLEAGMAKLLATKAAWEAADANVQIHGGNGFAEEYLASRLLVDSRVLSIFEGANEIQAHVVARRLLES
jgi:(2S)-methylsuccinyl-CoA dehydrogenase